jgi:putative ABC transport system permease protein
VTTISARSAADSSPDAPSSTGPRGVEVVEPSEIFFPIRQARAYSPQLVVRPRGEPAALKPTLAAAVRRVDPMQYAGRIETLGEEMSLEKGMLVLIGGIMATFAGAAMTLAMIGIYGVIAYLVVRRRQEIGIRMALGATGADVVSLAMRAGVRLGATGLRIGCFWRCC